ncbi:MAG: HAMP domain-containing sensor histidine kinase [Acidobacteriota bacterium]
MRRTASQPSALQRFAAGPTSLWLLAAALIGLLLVLASLQVRWLDAVSEADREKTRELLQTGVDRLAMDFDRELTLAYLSFLPRSGLHASDDDFVERHERWRAFAAFPELVREVFRVQVQGDAPELSRFDAQAGLFTTASWPPELKPLSETLQQDRLFFRREPPSEMRQPPSEVTVLADQIPALILPLISLPPPDGPGRREPSDRPEGLPLERGLLILWLDRDTIFQTMLPQLTERYLSRGDGISYHARIMTRDDGREIFEGGAPMTGTVVPRGDVGTDLFSLFPPQRLEQVGIGRELWPRRHHEGRRGGRRGRFEGRWLHRFYGFIVQQAAPRWHLIASHPSGSLDRAVARARRNNLTVSFGILLLLAASVVLILLSTRRRQALAKQQLEFVAGVTHELLTPLAAMRSAGQNLADGVIADTHQVQRYGRLIEDEGRRLTDMVGQVLEFAGIQAGRKTYSLQRARLEDIVDKALQEYRPVLDEKGCEIETRIEPDLPPILADAAALRRAIQNLLGNAIKYGAESSWIGLEARSSGDKSPEVQLSVEDRGPGIAAQDLPRLFEPFYRGGNGTDDLVPGSGLGLAIVQHIVTGHGGRVAVQTRQGNGSTFTLHLPVAPGKEEDPVDAA